MNALLERTNAATREIRRRLEPDSGLYVQPLVERMGLSRNRNQCGVFAVTAVRKGRGASHVTRLVAQELARSYRADTLVLTLDELMRLPYPPRARDTSLLHEWSPRSWSAVPSALLRQTCPMERLAIRIAELRDWGGGFALIDCPALEEGAATMNAATHTDGAVLTIAAGESERGEVQAAVRSFRNSETPLLGMVLNKRTYAIPQSIYRWL